jgi:MEMO1 family protein
MATRKAILSGSWYPDTSAGCRREIETFLDEIDVRHLSGRKFQAGIVPHAGWYFSGNIACNVIQCLSEEKDPTDAVVVFGMHLHPRSPNYIMTEGAWETPLGDIEIHTELAARLTERFDFTIETARQFTQDNTIEVQLPFIKYFFKNARLVPLGVPPDEKSLDIGKAVVEIARELGLRIKVIGSTDLTHYGTNYGFMPKGSGPKALDWVTTENDAGMISAMTRMNPEKVIRQGLAKHNACCSGAAASAIAAAVEMGATTSETVKYATSFEKSPGDSFVGYVGLLFE